MYLLDKLSTHFVGNIAMWLYYGGRKSMDEIVKKDNSTLGLILMIILGLILFLIFINK